MRLYWPDWYTCLYFFIRLWSVFLKSKAKKKPVDAGYGHEAKLQDYNNILLTEHSHYIFLWDTGYVYNHLKWFRLM